MVKKKAKITRFYQIELSLIIDIMVVFVYFKIMKNGDSFDVAIETLKQHLGANGDLFTI